VGGNTIEEGMDWIDLAKDGDSSRFYEHSNEIQGSIKCGEFFA